MSQREPEKGGLSEAYAWEEGGICRIPPKPSHARLHTNQVSTTKVPGASGPNREKNLR